MTSDKMCQIIDHKDHVMTKQQFSKSTKNESSYFIYSNFINLEDERILFIGSPKNQNKTFLKIFNESDINNPLVSSTLIGCYYFKALLSDNTILLGKDGYIFKFDLVSFELLHKQKSPFQNSCLQSFKNIFFDISYDSSNQLFDFIFYGWTNQGLEESRSIKLGMQSQHGRITQCVNLKDNRFACALTGWNSDNFGVLIFEVDFDSENQPIIKELHQLAPKAAYHGSSSWTEGVIKALPMVI